MATMISILAVASLAIAFAPWGGGMQNKRLHHLDTMAGDEGDD